MVYKIPFDVPGVKEIENSLSSILRFTIGTIQMKSFLVISLLVLVPSVRAQQVGLIANTDGRKTISLDGQWQTIVDPYESGFYDYRYQPSDNGFFKNAKPKSKSDLIEYDFDKSGSLKVPWRLEYAVRPTVLLRRHDLVQEIFRLPATTQHSPLRLLRSS